LENQDQNRSGSADPEVSTALVEQGYRQLPIALTVSLLNGFVLTVVLWGAVDTLLLLGWAFVLVVVTAGRFMLWRAFQQSGSAGPPEGRNWGRHFVSSSCAAGLVWGASGVVLFHPDSFSYQVFLAFVLGGMVAGAIPLTAPVRRAYPCFAVPVVLPVSIQMFAVGDRVHLIMGLLTLVFGAAMLASATQVQRLFRESENLRQRLMSSVKASESLEQLMRQDVLTEIPNRRLFEEKLEEEWRRARRDGGSLAVITADIDHFKEFNDRYGHPAGDSCLIKVAKTMADALYRPGDLVARMGGEEFAFLLPRTTLDGAGAVAEEIHQRILALDLLHEGSPTVQQVTVSFGVAASDGASVASPADLLRASDVALYNAKRGGRNRVAVFAE